jgi:hypothetical protein
LIYYGYPSAINGATTLAAAAATLASYNYVVLGDTLELASSADHNNTVAILSNPVLAHTTVFGYIDLGVSTQNLSIQEIENRIDEWKATGAQGIFLDDYGYDFGVTRARQNTIVAYAHSDGLVVAANAFNPADAFDSQVDANNPSGATTVLDASDFYLYESFQIQQGQYVDQATWLTKANALANYQATLGFKVLAVTTNSSANTYDANQFSYAWYSALLAGYEAIGWGEFDFSAVTAQAPYRFRPSPNPGSAFTTGLIVNGSTVSRTTNLGQIQVDVSQHTGTFTTG